MAKKKGGLTKWFKQEKWVDISQPKEGGGFEECGRSSASDSDRGYPKCVPSAKAARMTEKEIASAVRRKRSKRQGVGGKPTNVSTFAAQGGEIMKMKAKGMAKGGMMKAKGMAKGGAAMKTKGYAKGGAAMATKGAAKGGANNRKPAGPMRSPSSKKSGLYGR